MKKATLTTIRQYAADAGVEFDAEPSGQEWAVECYAPDGKLWRNHGTHFLALPADGYYGTPDWNETLTVLQGEVAGGFEDCVEEECDVCQS